MAPEPHGPAVDQLFQEGGKKTGFGLTPKNRLHGRQHGVKRLVEIRSITTCPTHRVGTNEGPRGRRAWDGGRLHHHVGCRAQRRPRHRKGHLWGPRRLEGARGRRERSSNQRQRRLGGWRNREPGRGPDRMFFYSVSPSRFFFLADWGEGDQRALLG